MTKAAHSPKKKESPEDIYGASNKGLLNEIEKIIGQVNAATFPSELKDELKETLERLDRAMHHSFYQAEFEQTTKYVEWILSLPWDKRSTDNIDLKKAQEILDRNHYDLTKIKERIVEYLAVLKLQSEKEKSSVVKLSRSPVLCFVGLPGTGKTTLASSIAESLGREFFRIPMGGMNSPLILRGQARAYPEAEPGMIIKALRNVQTKNPVILLDEVDSIAQGAESDIMGVLLELLDPEQNSSFMDYYVDYPFDLSEILFVCTANKIGNITQAVMDRLEVIMMPRYTDEDRIHIAKDYLLPKEMQNVGLSAEQVNFSEDSWPHVIKPFGYEVDIRTLQRTINGILRKVAKKYVEGQAKEVTITPTNLAEYLPEFA